MLAKSIIAGTVLSLMAGGVVYFGTDLDTAAVKEKVIEKTAAVKAELSEKVMADEAKKHPHSDKTDTLGSESSVDMPSVKTRSGKVIEAKKPIVSHTSTSPDKKIKTVEVVSPEEPQKKWLNQYLKTETPKKDIETETASRTVMTKPAATETEEGVEIEEKTDIAKDLMKSMGLTKEGGSDSDTGRFIVEDNDEEPSEGENIWVEEGASETGRKKATRKMLHDIIKKDRTTFTSEGPDGEKKVDIKVMANKDGKTTIETETIDMGDGKIMKIVKKTVTSETNDDNGHESGGKKMRIKVMADENGTGGISAEDIQVIRTDKKPSIDKFLMKAKSKDISGTVKIIMAQAEKIKMPELRDRAYLDLVSYSLDHDDYEVAAKALTKIEQVELRDTARNRIAVAHAKDGHTDEAFGILEDIEVDALRDVMRLQVIEAIIAPEELPEDMQ